MAKTFRDNEVTERLRSWIQDHYSARGKFTKLEADSLIPAQRWKDLYYGRQFASEEMLDFIRTQSSRDFQWIKTGVYLPRDSGYPFLTAPPTPEEHATLSTRLVWAIKEWTSPRGAALFSYLTEKSDGQISADDWASVLLGKNPPSPAMIEMVCTERRHFTEWIVTGTATCAGQVDPTNDTSIAQWKHAQQQQLTDFTVAWSKNADEHQKN
ncbi:hypothetical protein [Comamonas sp.]|uniref:hypothetical protein n=1 Tax=Comamonas sp. TaxID=34028 RepID=UPI00258C52ED|nr:hypothetical protein [Comamonas sp.]